jgi:uncharacterized lipoprotein NlpE involved in copper resistance
MNMTIILAAMLRFSLMGCNRLSEEIAARRFGKQRRKNSVSLP